MSLAPEDAERLAMVETICATDGLTDGEKLEMVIAYLHGEERPGDAALRRIANHSGDGQCARKGRRKLMEAGILSIDEADGRTPIRYQWGTGQTPVQSDGGSVDRVSTGRGFHQTGVQVPLRVPVDRVSAPPEVSPLASPLPMPPGRPSVRRTGAREAEQSPEVEAARPLHHALLAAFEAAYQQAPPASLSTPEACARLVTAVALRSEEGLLPSLPKGSGREEHLRYVGDVLAWAPADCARNGKSAIDARNLLGVSRLARNGAEGFLQQAAFFDESNGTARKAPRRVDIDAKVYTAPRRVEL